MVIIFVNTIKIIIDEKDYMCISDILNTVIFKEGNNLGYIKSYI